MCKVTFAPGETVIRQGDPGENLYVVEKGILICTKVSVSSLCLTIQNDGKHEEFLKEYLPGEAFGELALLYNVPRAANIVAKTDAELWALDRRTFNHIVKDSAQQKRDKYEQFFK